MAAKVFFSYSHKDEELRDQLEVQLTMLKRQGLIDTWHDRRLKPGDHLDFNINKNLEEADVILLLISPDFLASTYCYKIEKARALQRVEEGTAKLISVILRPCEWDQTDLRYYVVTPTDGKPITKWADKDDAFLDVARSIRRAIEEVGATRVAGPPAETVDPARDARLPRSSNLRMTKTFTEADKDNFLHETFVYMGNFFEGSLSELRERNSSIEVRFRAVDANRFTCAIYRGGRKASSCTVFMRGAFGGNSIHYSSTDNAETNAYNESVGVEIDQQSMHLKASMSSVVGGKAEDHKLSQLGAAELFWSLLIEPLQR